jgi:hypothetical protein
MVRDTHITFLYESVHVGSYKVNEIEIRAGHKVGIHCTLRLGSVWAVALQRLFWPPGFAFGHFIKTC